MLSIIAVGIRLKNIFNLNNNVFKTCLIEKHLHRYLYRGMIYTKTFSFLFIKYKNLPNFIYG